MPKFALLLLPALLSVAAWAQPSPPAIARELRLSTALGPAYEQGRAAEAWAQLIRTRSGGRITVKTYPGATLVQRDPTREFLGLRDGSIDLAIGSTLAWSTQVRELNLFALPWLVQSHEALEVLLRGETGARLFERIETAGAIPLAWADNDLPELATRMAISAPQDLAGLRIRALASPLVTDTLLALGAAPVTMGFVEAQSELAAGKLDGQETTTAAYALARDHALGLRHLTLWGAHADALVFAVARATWTAWSEADRELVRAAAGEVAEQTTAAVRKRAQRSALAELAARGAIVVALTPAGKQAFRAAAQPVYERWSVVVGVDLVRAAETAIAAPVQPGDSTPATGGGSSGPRIEERGQRRRRHDRVAHRGVARCQEIP